jgi:hypothetical protein
MLGQVFYQSNIILEENQDYPINFATKAAGVYLVIIRTKEKIFHSKLVLQ